MQDFGMVQPTASILHQDTIRRLSGDGAFERGKAYAAQGWDVQPHEVKDEAR